MHKIWSQSELNNTISRFGLRRKNITVNGKKIYEKSVNKS